MEPITTTILSSICLSLTYDILKGTYSLLKKEFADSIFECTINETISYFHKEELELKKEYFSSTLISDLIYNEIIQFDKGEKEISLEVFIEEFSKSDFYFQDNRYEKIRDIMNYFLNQFIKYLILDKENANLVLYSILKIHEKNSSKYYFDIKTINEQLKFGIEQISQQTIETKKIAIDTHKKVDLLLSYHEMNQTDSDKDYELNLANEFFNRGKIFIAIEKYEKILESTKLSEKEKLFKLYRNLGNSYKAIGNNKEAICNLNLATNLFPTEIRCKIENMLALIIDDQLANAINIGEDILKQSSDIEEVIKIQQRARRYLANAYISMNKPRMALELYNNYGFDGNWEDYYIYAWILQNCQEYNEAENNYQKSYNIEKKGEILLTWSGSIIFPLFEKIRNGDIIEGDRIKDRLKEALNLLNEAIELFNDRDEIESKKISYFNRAAVHQLLGNNREALTDLSRCEELGDMSLILYNNMGAIYAQNGMLKEAIESYTKAYEIDMTTFPNLFKVLYDAKQYSNAKEVLKRHLPFDKYEIDNNNIDLYLNLAEIYLYELELQKSKILMYDIEKKFTNHIHFIITKARFLWMENKKEESIKYLEQKIMGEAIKNPNCDGLLASFHMYFQNWEKALEIYLKYYQKNELTFLINLEIIHLNILICYHNLIKIIEFERVYSNIQFKLNSNQIIADRLYGNLLRITENFLKAIEIYERIAPILKEAEIYFIWGECLFRLGRYSEAKQKFRIVEHEFSNNFEILLRISSAYCMFGNTFRAVILSLKLVNKNPDDSRVYRNFMTCFINHTQSYPRNHRLGQEYMQLFQNLPKINERFIDDPFIQEFSGNDADGTVQMIKKYLIEMEENNNINDEIYQQSRMPISIYAKARKDIILHTWGHIVSQRHLNIWSFDLRRMQNNLNMIKNTLYVIIEPVSLLLLFSINQHDKLKSFFKKVFFPQRFYDELRNEIQIMKMTPNNDSDVHTRTGSMLGQIWIEEIPNIIYQQSIERLEELCEFIKNDLIGFTVLDNDTLEKERERILNPSSLQAFNYAIKNGYAIICDEENLLKLHDFRYQINSFSTYSFITILFNNRTLTKDDYYTCILKLITLGYYFIPMNKDLLIFVIQQSDFNPNNSIETVFLSLKGKDKNPVLTIKVILEFLIELYDENISDFKKDFWLNYSLNYLPREIWNLSDILDILNNEIKLFNQRQRIQRPQLDNWLIRGIRLWSNKQILPIQYDK